ncbi:MAG: twin-arginine translocation signal domain-containing protein, partial [Planctomycetales bacterium]|nr:twin-arginine translocation signal domain-containing protein [Planctomycetales bacterium]
MSNPRSCPDCNSSRFELDRRQFVRATAVGAVAASTGIFIRPISAEEPAAKKPETLVAQLYKSLNEQQRAAVCFGFDHPLRQEVDNNWHITKTRVADFTADQQDLIREIFNGLHDPEYAQQVMQQVEHDNGRRPDVPKSGFGSCAIAMFGEPGTGKFEFVFTGRHVTRRCDGDSIEGAAFGGPIFYGHAAKSF